jgi:hypothetical protein
MTELLSRLLERVGGKQRVLGLTKLAMPSGPLLCLVRRELRARFKGSELDHGGVITVDRSDHDPLRSRLQALGIAAVVIVVVRVHGVSVWAKTGSRPAHRRERRDKKLGGRGNGRMGRDENSAE